MSRYELDTLKTLFRTVYTRILKIWTDMYTASEYALPLNTAVAWNIFIFLPEYNTVVDGVFVVFAGSNGLINNTYSLKGSLFYRLNVACVLFLVVKFLLRGYLTFYD